MPAAPKHPIQIVARRTGLSPDVIRAWERRYAVVNPTRSATGRRLYSDRDIDRLTLLRRATSGGRRIGDVADLSHDALSELVSADESAVAQAAGTPPSRPTTGSVMEHFEECLEAVHLMKPAKLKLALVKARDTLGIPFLLEDLLGPLFQYIGDECRSGHIRLSQEQMATVLVRSYLCTLIPARSDATGNLKIVVTTPRGQHHDLGALDLAVSATFVGWETIYLGVEMPADEIAFAVVQSEARAVALALDRPAGDPHLPNELRKLRQALRDGTTVLAAGATAESYEEALRAIKATRVRTLGEFRRELHQIMSIDGSPRGHP